MDSLPRVRGRARVGAFVAEARYRLAPIPAFPRKRGKENSIYFSTNARSIT